MEILKKGTAHLSEVWRCNCPFCGTIVKIIKGDPDIIRYHNCSSSFREEVYWKCPICESEVCSHTGEHHGSPWENVESRKTEVLTPKEAEQLESWDCRRKCTNSDDSYYYVGKWNSNN